MTAVNSIMAGMLMAGMCGFWLFAILTLWRGIRGRGARLQQSPLELAVRRATRFLLLTPILFMLIAAAIHEVLAAIR